MARDLKLQVLLDAVDKATGPLKKITQGSGKTAEALRASRDELRNLERQQRDLKSFRKLREATRENGEALAASRERLRQMRDELKKTDAPSEKFQRQFKQTSDEVDRLTGKLGDQRRRLGELRTGLRQGGVSTDNLGESENRLADRIREANTQLATQKTRMGEVAAAQRKAQAAADQYQRGIGRANNMRSAGMTGLATGGGALYAGSRLLAPGIQYGETMSRVQALTRLDDGSEQMQALRDQARDLGSSTAFSASEVGQGQSFLAMAGFTPEAIRQAMPDMLNMALAGDLDLGRTADISSNILSGFGLDPDQMGRVSDVLTATTTRANVDLEMLGESMKYVAPQARQMGVSMEEAAAMTALLGNVGIQGSQAGTTLRAMMTRLAAPTGAAAGALDELGVQAKTADGDLREVPKILAEVAAATEEMGNAERAEYLKSIFGEEPGAGMAELIAQQGAEGIEQFVGLLEGAAGESGRVAATMADNIGGDLKSLRSAWEEVGISITDTNEGPLRELVQTVTDITRGVGDWIKENPKLAGTVAKLAAGTAALVAVGGALTIMLASLLGPIVTARYGLAMLGLRTTGLGGRVYALTSRILPALGKGLLAISRGFLFVATSIGKAGLALLASPMTWIILGIVAAVAALAGAAYLVYKNWGAISAWFGQRWQDVKDAFSNGIGGVARLLLNWNPLGLIYRGIIAGLEALGVEVPARFASLGELVVGSLGDALSGVLSLVRGIWATIREAISGGLGSIGRLLLDWSPLGLLQSAITSALSALGVEVPEQFKSLGGMIIDGLIGGLSGRFGALKDTVTGIAGNVTGWFKDKMGINSPSRVFAELGGHTVDGLTLGLERQRDEPARRVADIASRARKAGAGLALGAMAMPAAAMPSITPGEPIRFDSRPPITAGGGQPSIDQRITLGDIHITASPGMDERQLAQYVAAEVQRALENARRDQSARERSTMWDRD